MPIVTNLQLKTMDDSSQFKFDQIKLYLESHCFPSQFSGDRGLKANLKRQSRGFEVRHGGTAFCIVDINTPK